MHLASAWSCTNLRSNSPPHSRTAWHTHHMTNPESSKSSWRGTLTILALGLPAVILALLSYLYAKSL